MIAKMKVFKVELVQVVGDKTLVTISCNNPVSIAVEDEIEIWMVFQGRLKKKALPIEIDDEEDEKEDIETDNSKLKDFNIFGSGN